MKLNQPSIILVRPQLPENIGMVARVMENYNLNELIIVSPREKWPNNKSLESSKKAKKIIKNTKVFNSLSEALTKFQLVVATTNRKRFLEKKKINSFSALNRFVKINKNTAILFGPENSGLSNEDLRLANYLFTINTSKKNSSLNLSHAVAIVSFKIYESLSIYKNISSNLKNNSSELSNKKELSYFMNYLTNELEKVNFFYPLSKKQSMIDNIYAIFLKASLTKKETNTLWGMLKKLRKY